MTKTSTAPRTGRRTQAERRDESGRGLVAAAVAVVSEHGVSAATFDNIGRKGGYSRGLVGQRFGSKQGLIEAVIEHLLVPPNPDILGELQAMSGLDALLYYADLHIRWLPSWRGWEAYFRLLSWTVADVAPQRELFASATAKVRDLFESWIIRGQAEGSIHKDIDPVAGARMVSCLLEGVSMQMLVDESMDGEPVRKTTAIALRRAFAA